MFVRRARLLEANPLGAGIEQPFDCLIVQNHQAVQSMGRSIDWTLEDNMVDGLFLCATFTGRRGGHTPFVQTGAETSDTGAEVVKLDPRCSRQGHFKRWMPMSKMTVGRSVVFPTLRIPLVIRPDRCTSVVVVK